MAEIFDKSSSLKYKRIFKGIYRPSVKLPHLPFVSNDLASENSKALNIQNSQPLALNRIKEMIIGLKERVK